MRNATQFLGPRARIGGYGLTVGLIFGVWIGVWMTSQEWLLPTFYRRWMHDPHHFAKADPPGGGDPIKRFNVAGLTVPRHEIFDSGPPKDAIPALVRPAHVPVVGADFLQDDDRVIGLNLQGETRAYPIRLLSYHQVVNDELGGVPIAVVYCPFCDSVSVMDRRIGGKTLEFGVSGQMLNSNSLIYDRTDNALWSQVGCQALSGPFAGQSLRHYNSWEIALFKPWSQRHRDATVLSFKTGYWREYQADPYAPYLAGDMILYRVSGADDRLPPMTPVLGICAGGAEEVFTLDAVKAAPGGQLESNVGGGRVVLAAEADDREIAILESPPESIAIRTAWFAWAAFHHDTKLISGADGK